MKATQGSEVQRRSPLTIRHPWPPLLLPLPLLPPLLLLLTFVNVTLTVRGWSISTTQVAPSMRVQP